jgi:hypothetical protein
MATDNDVSDDAGQGDGAGKGDGMEEDKGGALKLKNRKKQKRPKNTTARKSSNKLGNK